LPVTIHDVAKKAGVGIGTVSSVLNNSRPVNPATRQKVLTAVAELDFVPNPSGRRLSMGKTHTIGVIIPFFTRPSHVQRLRGVMSIIAGSEYDVVLFTVETIPQRNDILQTVPRRGRVDGLLIFSIDPTEADVKRIHQEEIPTVLVEAAHPDLCSFVPDDTTAAQNAIQYLVDLGHRKIAYINENLEDPFGFPFSRNRYQGYRQALEEANLSFNPDYYRESVYGRDEGQHMAFELLNLPDPPTAIFTYCDIYALGILEAARELNLNVPDDLSVVGYDDIELAQFAQLTTVRQYLFESGVRGVELLFEAIDNPDTNPMYIKFLPELVIRETTAPPP
jgi:DNA-binding LacI/PurR family transcriptional regulator